MINYFRLHGSLLALAAGLAGISTVLSAQPVIKRTIDESVEAPVVRPAARQGSPNILIWMIDDMGFGQLSAYGGLVDTPNIDRVAAKGLRYANYHSTPICSASRASLLTGRNSHEVHIGGHSAMAIGFPGQDALVPRSAGTIAENLRQAGYRTYAVGKWDHLPPRDASAAGPFTYWPSGQGFDRFYGFLSYDADNFSPLLWSDHSPSPIPADDAYHLSGDMADQAIAMIRARSAAGTERAPFFLYWATGASHSPHHAPDDWLERYRGRFDAGWDVARAEILARQKAMGLIPASAELPPRPEGMKAWADLTPNERKLHARGMEAFAAQLAHADHEFGRMLQALEEQGELDNTIIVVTSDNGASAEGAPNGTYSEQLMANGRFATADENLEHLAEWGRRGTYPLYAVGWAVTGNTPFRYYKQTSFEGGIRVPLIITWPKGIGARGEVRQQYAHISDVMPTLLEAAGVTLAPIVNGVRQQPVSGTSLAYSFSQAAAPDAKKVQYYEMYGNRSIWADGWKAVMPHRLQTWDFKKQSPLTEQGWQLFDQRRDFNELHDVAAENPRKLAELRKLFDREARKYNVFPLTNTGAAQRLMAAKAEARLTQSGGLYRYQGRVDRVPEALAPPIHTHSFAMRMAIDAGTRGHGSLMAMGGKFGGLGLYLRDGVPVLAVRTMDGKLAVLEAPNIVTGKHEIGLRFDRLGPERARAVILVDGKEVAASEFSGALSVFIFSGNETFDIGSDPGTTVLDGVAMPFAFNGSIGETEFMVTSPAR
ncbi:arylsulfatase [Sphingopyxis yananensis]|uniref:arylsulfatase n=1 Tax=Sphingopyxis yananensis TaxID=2886687 RepID=UPI001D110DBE|nr:arylsulfatase [Sphingopyxis yananensis]MCC2601977.1 arylsulfatase [Sphingopyxis yananensis]